TAVPMGVDMDLIHSLPRNSPLHQDFRGYRVLIYIGTLERARELDFLFLVLSAVCKQVPNVLLLMMGDSPEVSDLPWLQRRAQEEQVAEQVRWLGRLPMQSAWH